jgi:hypothetical protein
VTKGFKAEIYFVIIGEKKEMDRQIVLLQIGYTTKPYEESRQCALPSDDERAGDPLAGW